MTASTPRKQKLKPTSVYAILRKDILTLRLPPGEPLLERSLADRYEVSRTPVREALHRLEAEGLARRYPKMGMVVAELTLRDVVEAFQIRELIEPPSAAEAARVLEADPLRELLVRFKELDSPGLTDEEKYKRHDELDAKVHDLILGAFGNSRLTALMDTIRGVCSRARALGTPMRFSQSTQEHAAILEALIARDSTGAEKAMREHLDSTRQRLVQIF